MYMAADGQKASRPELPLVHGVQDASKLQDVWDELLVLQAPVPVVKQLMLLDLHAELSRLLEERACQSTNPTL